MLIRSRFIITVITVSTAITIIIISTGSGAEREGGSEGGAAALCGLKKLRRIRFMTGAPEGARTVSFLHPADTDAVSLDSPGNPPAVVLDGFVLDSGSITDLLFFVHHPEPDVRCCDG